jgi:NAD(P)H-hydrate epimerase
MKVVSSQTMQELDRLTIERFGVPGVELMERAGRNCADIIEERYGSSSARTATVCAGKGNNGGDGLVIARLLHERGWTVSVLLLGTRDELRGDAKVNLKRLPAGVLLLEFHESSPSWQTQLSGADVVVDALFGTGLNSQVSGVHADIVGLINASGRPVVAVDIPSGIDATTGKVLGAVVRAEVTVTFALAKLGHILYPGAAHVGELLVTDIGIPAELISGATGVEYVDGESAALLLRPRSLLCHKGDNGHSLIVAGSTGKSGAASMAANSAMRSGAGLVTLAAPASIHGVLEVKTTEAMTVPLADNGFGALAMAAVVQVTELFAGRDVVAIGPGLGLLPETQQLVRELVAAASLPLVLDADALNAVAGHLEVLKNSGAPAVIMTPHPGEMGRLVAIPTAAVEADRLGVASAFATKNRVHLVLKGARTVVAAPDGRLAVNASGNPGMASGGMGDVLTGVITALLAQGYEPFVACCLGVYCHGAAADLVALEKGEIGLIATDVQEMLPKVFKTLIEKETNRC